VDSDRSQLNCLVLSDQQEHHKRVSGWLGVSKRVGSVTAVNDDISLCKHLSVAAAAICILVVENREQPLPACILRYPQMPVLVLSVGGKTGKLLQWLQQGATDVVSLKKTAAAQHAISRLIDQCTLQQRQRYLETRTRQLEQEVAYLKSMLQSDKRSFALSASNDNTHDSLLQLESDLRQTERPLIENVVAKQQARDEATGLPARRSVLRRFQSLLQADIKPPKFTAMLVRILTSNSTDERPAPHTNGAAKTVQDLTLYRAASALQKSMGPDSIIGRVNQNALLLIQSSGSDTVSRNAANQVRETLGSLGGLIDGGTDVRINTMTLPSKSRFTANDVVARLEAR